MHALVYRMLVCSGVAFCLHVFAHSTAASQADSGEVFRFLPKYEPEEEAVLPPPPPAPDVPAIAWKPELHYPDDPSLEGRAGKVWVKAFVTADGVVAGAEVLLSSDTLFNPHALAHIRRYRFAWPEGPPPRDTVPVALLVDFTP
jgi:TonB family protein